MRLSRFRVINFRSVRDSGWIEAESVTALIGTNEAGKTNLLLPLWKLNPAIGGEITPTSDFPRKLYNDIRTMETKPVFIEALFDSSSIASKLAALTGAPESDLRTAIVKRNFDAGYTVGFPDAKPKRSLERTRVTATLERAKKDFSELEDSKGDAEVKDRILNVLDQALSSLPEEKEISAATLKSLFDPISKVDTASLLKKSLIPGHLTRLNDKLGELLKEVSIPHPESFVEARKLIMEHLPKFVYYSNYGNLDSEIYLPHVIDNLERDGLGSKEMAKARTLRVLFKFVGLEPKEILELGEDFKDPAKPARKPTDEEVAAIAEKKKERSILLQSASSKLTSKFRDWWKQGNYRFRFEADGGHFRIWVSDDRRTEEVELENRSTGLQWFLSFYLVFLVESEEAHEGAVLLLDEPGLSLHPMAQRDLSAFFDGLAESNQLLYTTHSPFLVDSDRLERVRKVYVGADGSSMVSSDLRAGSESDATQKGAGYTVAAAVGLSVGESLLIGCTPVIVEGPSDQHYLSAIKNALTGAGRIKPSKELVFPPAGGVKTVKAVSSVLGSRENDLPRVLLDSDSPGRKMAQELRQGLYANDKGKVIEVSEFGLSEDSEIEDLIPTEVVIDQVDRWIRTPEEPFKDAYVAGKPIVPQLEAWAKQHGVPLELGWKVELSKRVKGVLLKRGVASAPEDLVAKWQTLFERLLG